MAAQTTTTTENIVTETIATNWSVNRLQMPDGTSQHSLTLAYADDKFAVGANGQTTPLALGMNAHWLSLDVSKTAAILATVITLGNGTQTTLGGLWEALLDIEIRADLAAVKE